MSKKSAEDKGSKNHGLQWFIMNLMKGNTEVKLKSASTGEVLKVASLFSIPFVLMSENEISCAKSVKIYGGTLSTSDLTGRDRKDTQRKIQTILKYH